MKKLSKRGLIALSVTLGVIMLLFVAVMIYYFGASYKTFEKLSEKSFKIPGLNEKFTPQGMAYDKNNKKFLVCGYMANHKASRIYIINQESGETEKFVSLKTAAADYTEHAGGIAVYNNTAWVVGDKMLNRLSLTELYTAEDGASVEFVDSLEMENGADFATVLNDTLYVGEFYRKGSHPTDPTHKLISSDNTTTNALALAFPIDENKDYGLGSTFPAFGLSLPDLAQGMCFDAEGNIIVSTSYSIPDSHIYIYKSPLGESPTRRIDVNGSSLNIYMLEKSNIKTTLTLPCMSEEIVEVNDKLYVLFENNCSKYKFFVRTRLNNVYAIDLKEASAL